MSPDTLSRNFLCRGLVRISWGEEQWYHFCPFWLSDSRNHSSVLINVGIEFDQWIMILLHWGEVCGFVFVVIGPQHSLPLQSRRINEDAKCEWLLSSARLTPKRESFTLPVAPCPPPCCGSSSVSHSRCPVVPSPPPPSKLVFVFDCWMFALDLDAVNRDDVNALTSLIWLLFAEQGVFFRPSPSIGAMDDCCLGRRQEAPASPPSSLNIPLCRHCGREEMFTHDDSRQSIQVAFFSEVRKLQMMTHKAMVLKRKGNVHREPATEARRAKTTRNKFPIYSLISDPANYEGSY